MDMTKDLDINGNVKLPSYIYRTINQLMKTSLDMGTLLCTDPTKLRAYKEQIKSIFKNQWIEIAEVLVSQGLIEPCVCEKTDFCSICSGSRYILEDSKTFIEEIDDTSIAMSSSDPKIEQKLKRGLQEAIQMVHNRIDVH